MIVGVKYNNQGKIIYVQSDIDVNIGDMIVIDSNKAYFLVKVYEVNVQGDREIKGEVLRLSTDEDYDTYLKNLSLAQKALVGTKKIVKKSGLNMKLIDANYSLDKKQLIFNFVSEERVDFRSLVKEIANKYKARIELFQIGVRDKASMVGGIGFCGRKLCCSNSLKNLSSINISMVKKQNIALNPSKINGPCGRLLCCFTYEFDLYEENLKCLPKIGEKIKRNNKKAVVDSLDVLNKEYTIKYEDGVKEIVKVDDK